MTHDVTVSAAECAECKRDHLPNCYRNQTVGHYGGGPADCDCGWRTLGLKHLQAQKDAWWRKGQNATNSDNPLKVLSDAKPPEDCCRGAAPDQHCECAKREAAIIRRAQREARK